MSTLRNSVALLLGAASLAAAAQSPSLPMFMAGCWAGEHADSRNSSYEVWMATHAEFANPEHDFPQRVRYAREGDLLRAEISGGNPVCRIEFRFRKVACENLTNTER